MTTTRHEPGIYFGMPEDEYHADPALGSTDLKRLLTSPPDYWWNSIFNPARPESDDKAHLVFGSAVHKIILEGREAFDRLYRRLPDAEDCLVTDEHVSKWCVENVERIRTVRDRLMDEADDKGGDDMLTTEEKAVLDLIHRAAEGKLPKTKSGKADIVRIVAPEVVVLDHFKARGEAEGWTALPGADYDRILTAGHMIAKNPNLATAFEGGASEVSVFWEADLFNDGTPPVPCKCRLDYLKVRGIGDLKSIGNTRGAPLPIAARTSIATFRYDMQAAHYMEGRRQIANLVREGRVFGDHDKAWLAKVAARKSYGFAFVFFQSQGAPITWATQLSPGNPIIAEAAFDVRVAMENYCRFMRDFGPDAAWVLTEPVAELDISEMPGFYRRTR